MDFWFKPVTRQVGEGWGLRGVLLVSLVFSSLGFSVNKPLHHLREGFTNPYLPEGSRPGIGRYLWMRITDWQSYADWEGKGDLVPRVPVVMKELQDPNPKIPQVTWIGHSTFLIQYQGINVLTDPIFSKRCSPVSWAGPKRITSPAVSLEQLPAIDYVVISHSHYDHLDSATVISLPGHPVFFVPLKLKSWFLDQGIQSQNIRELDWWDGEVWDDLWVQALPSQHFSSRTPFDFNQTLWASWLVMIGNTKFWFAGDTGYNPYQFKEIGEKLGPIDLAMIPIGAYSPRWFMKPQHVNPKEAVQMAFDVKARRVVGMHWGTFQLSAEDVMEPVNELQQEIDELGLLRDWFVALAIGEKIMISDF